MSERASYVQDIEDDTSSPYQPTKYAPVSLSSDDESDEAHDKANTNYMPEGREDGDSLEGVSSESEGEETNIFGGFGSKVPDWNAELQELLSRKDSVEKFRKISSLATDFLYVAEAYGRYLKFLKYSELTFQNYYFGAISRRTVQNF